jgi:hypothetical protein
VSGSALALPLIGMFGFAQLRRKATPVAALV